MSSATSSASAASCDACDNCVCRWADQAAGIAECARVLAPGGHLVLADQFSLLLWPTLVAGRRGKARTRARATRLVQAAGLRSPHWHRVHAVIIQAVTAVK
jgi:SAM-dependent methyltransferase